MLIHILFNTLIQTQQSIFPKLSLSHTEIQPLYDVVIIGSGYGASIAASRCARAGQNVCVFERGREWQPGDFPESMIESKEHFQINYQGKPNVVGMMQNSLIEIFCCVQRFICSHAIFNLYVI